MFGVALFVELYFELFEVSPGQFRRAGQNHLEGRNLILVVTDKTAELADIVFRSPVFRAIADLFFDKSIVMVGNRNADIFITGQLIKPGTDTGSGFEPGGKVGKA
ncbi:hypothetical protein MASR1M12_09190 [Erysipelotrichia bacterium]